MRRLTPFFPPITHCAKLSPQFLLIKNEVPTALATLLSPQNPQTLIKTNLNPSLLKKILSIQLIASNSCQSETAQVPTAPLPFHLDLSHQSIWWRESRCYETTRCVACAHLTFSKHFLRIIEQGVFCKGLVLSDKRLQWKETIRLNLWLYIATNRRGGLLVYGFGCWDVSLFLLQPFLHLTWLT